MWAYLVRSCPRKRTLEQSCRVVAFEPVAVIAAIRLTGRYGIFGRDRADHSGLMPADLITLPHFSVSSAMSLPKSAGESASTSPPRSASRVFSLGSARAALISLLSLSMIAEGVFLGAPTPNQPLAS